MAIYSDSGFITARDTPLIRPTLDLNFAREKRLDSRVTFTRASSATYVDEYGVIRTAANNVPRFDHDSVTGESLGLLIEESRTNQFSGSDFASGWNTSNVSLVTTGILDPAGGTTARKAVALTTDGSATAFFLDDTTILTGTTYTQSIWAKANVFPVSGNAHYVLQIAPSTRFDSRYQNFDLSTGTLGTGDVQSATIEAFPDGWYRCSVTQTSISGGTGRMVFAIANSPTDTRLQSASTGSANNDGIYVWGPQLEVGSFPTSYIPTSGATATRSADLASITGTNFTSWYNPTESTMFVETSMPNNNGAVGIPSYAFKLTTDSNKYYGFFRDVVAPYHYVRTTDLNTYIFGSLASKYKAALAIKENDINSYINTTQNVNSTNVTLFTPDILYLGNTDISNINILNGHIKRFMYYPTRLPNDQLQALTL